MKSVLIIYGITIFLHSHKVSKYTISTKQPFQYPKIAGRLGGWKCTYVTIFYSRGKLREVPYQIWDQLYRFGKVNRSRFYRQTQPVDPQCQAFFTIRVLETKRKPEHNQGTHSNAKQKHQFPDFNFEATTVQLNLNNFLSIDTTL